MFESFLGKIHDSVIENYLDKGKVLTILLTTMERLTFDVIGD